MPNRVTLIDEVTVCTVKPLSVPIPLLLAIRWQRSSDWSILLLSFLCTNALTRPLPLPLHAHLDLNLLRAPSPLLLAFRRRVAERRHSIMTIRRRENDQAKSCLLPALLLLRFCLFSSRAFPTVGRDLMFTRTQLLLVSKFK